MPKLIKFFALLLIIINFKGADGQVSYNLPPQNFYERATISTMDLQKMRVSKLSIFSDRIQFFRSGQLTSLPLENINYIRVKEGSKAKNGAFIGGVSMFALCITSVLQAQMDPNYEFRESVGGRVAMFTLGGAAVGALIGSLIPKETSYYVHIFKNHGFQQ